MSETILRDDIVIPFQVGETAVRGRVVRLSGSVDVILNAHDFPDEVSELVGEACALVSMMGASLKFDGKLIFQGQGNGPVPMIVADISSNGALRAMAKVEGERFERGAGALLGKGHIAMTIDQGPDMDLYQGVTPIEGDNLAEAAVSYFAQSEQIPTLIKLAVGRLSIPGEPDRWRAGGLMAQYVPGEGGLRERGEEAIMSGDDREVWDRTSAFIGTVNADELLDPSIDAKTLLYRLFHEDGVRVFETRPVRAECSCNGGKIAAVLERYSEEDLSDMVDDGAIRVTCEFCQKTYLFGPKGDPLGVT